MAMTARSSRTCSCRGLYSAFNTLNNAIPQLIIAGCKLKYTPKIFMKICLTAQTLALAMGLEHIGLSMHECTWKKNAVENMHALGLSISYGTAEYLNYQQTFLINHWIYSSKRNLSPPNSKWHLLWTVSITTPVLQQGLGHISWISSYPLFSTTF